MEIPFTQRSDGEKNGKVSSTAEGSAEGTDIPDRNETNSKENETDLTPAVQMQMFTNCEDESELETVEIIALNSSGQQLGNETMAKSYLVQGKTLFICLQNEIKKHLTYLDKDDR